MKSINFIVPYFGNFPNYFQLYLNSCAMNPDFHWTIITDNEKSYRFPKNVKVIHQSFTEVQKKIQEKFDFEISFSKVYKLCDMKPMYGYLFEKYNTGFDFWGYCDVDMILGDLSHFITDEMLAYDKIFTLGHMTIMRNTERMNRLFMAPINGENYYVKVLQSESSFNFDEDFLDRVNINTICRTENIDIWEQSVIADIYTKSSDLRRTIMGRKEKKCNSYFVWNKGKLFRRIKQNGRWETEEYMYIHLQKRKMHMNLDESSSIYKIIPNEFANLEIDEKEIGEKDDKVKTKNFNLQYFEIRSQNLITKIKRKI